MKLKNYQQKALDKISEFLKELEKQKPAYAYMYITNQPYKSDFFGDEVPYICIKIPTGGGKTLVGCHSVCQIMDSFLKEKLGKGIVMWFVPSEAIKIQTLRKFKDRTDMHRKVLDEYFDNNVKIFSNEEALRIKKDDVDNNLCIIVSSLDAFRKEKTLQAKYKVYQENGELLDHFENIEDSNVLEKDESGVIKSLANVIRLSNPLIVVDEGHRAKTLLSVEFLKSLNPSFVIEYTATPRSESNVLVRIHSSELKEEDMVKLPIVLESHTQWQNAIKQGVLKREELEKLAKKEKGEYIRPIALLQAEQEKEDENKVTVRTIKEFLLKECSGIKEEEIAIKTSKQNDLENIDLFSDKCKIKYIITVNALAEGWDCSYAYILISVTNIGSRIAVEQIIGRIMRLPFASRKENEGLNRSYVFASAKNFNEAATEVISGLESNGYSRFDLINAPDKPEPYQFEVERRVSEDFTPPMMAYEDDELSFEDLIGEEFELAKQNSKIDFKVHYDSDGRALIDIKEGDKWVRGAQKVLKITYHDKNCSKNELIQWLDKRLRFTMLEKEDKVAFLRKALDNIKGYTLQDLSVNRYLLLEKLDNAINKILVDHAKTNFDKYVKEGKIKTKPFEKFPDKIMLEEESPQEFNKNYYKKIDKLNKEEKRFVERLDLDTLPNIKFWIRNREKKDPFYLQGWKPDKFYPDFLAFTDKNNTIALEWKGEHLISNEDTKYKTDLAKEWEKLGNGKLHFFLVSNDNIDDVLSKVKTL
jgi:superfamily II DNA or RNA helicase